MYFRARNDYAAIDVADADFVLCDHNNSDQVLDQVLPPRVQQAIQVLRDYAVTVESAQ